MKRDLDRRLVALETRQAITLHRRTLTTPTYTTARPGEPRPKVDGPVYWLVPATGRVHA